MKNWTSLRKIFLSITDPELQQIVCGIAVRSYYFNLYSKNAKKLKNCRRATIVFTCKFCDIFSVYTVTFQHLFQPSVTRPMKSISELRSFIVFSLGRTEAVCQRCSKTLFTKNSRKDVFLWNPFFTYSRVFFIISNIIFASACFLQYYLYYNFLENDANLFFIQRICLKLQISKWLLAFVFSCMLHSPFTRDPLATKRKFKFSTIWNLKSWQF